MGQQCEMVRSSTSPYVTLESVALFVLFVLYVLHVMYIPVKEFKFTATCMKKYNRNLRKGLRGYILYCMFFIVQRMEYFSIQVVKTV